MVFARGRESSRHFRRRSDERNDDESDKRRRHSKSDRCGLHGTDEYFAHKRDQHGHSRKRAQRKPDRPLRFRFFTATAKKLAVRFQRKEQTEAIGEKKQNGEGHAQVFFEIVGAWRWRARDDD